MGIRNFSKFFKYYASKNLSAVTVYEQWENLNESSFNEVGLYIDSIALIYYFLVTTINNEHSLLTEHDYKQISESAVRRLVDICGNLLPKLKITYLSKDYKAPYAKKPEQVKRKNNSANVPTYEERNVCFKTLVSELINF